MTTIRPNPARCGGCVSRCQNHDCTCALFWVLVIAGLAFIAFCQPGCVPSQPLGAQTPFEPAAVDACLAIVVDQSGSFSDSWDQRAYPLFLELMDQFFTQGAGEESRIILAQMSGDKRVVLFEGQPEDLRGRFRSPEELVRFLRERSDPTSSPVYRSLGRALEYISAVPGMTTDTRMMTVVLSDMADNEQVKTSRTANAHRMVAAIKQYQELGGGLALYCVSPDQTSRWREILQMSGFGAGRYVIESDLVERPRLPRFD